MGKRNPSHRTRRTQERLTGYAEVMGYDVVGHHHGFVIMEHTTTGTKVDIPATSDTSYPQTQMTQKVWSNTYRALALGALHGKRSTD